MWIHLQKCGPYSATGVTITGFMFCTCLPKSRSTPKTPQIKRAYQCFVIWEELIWIALKRELCDTYLNLLRVRVCVREWERALKKQTNQANRYSFSLMFKIDMTEVWYWSVFTAKLKVDFHPDNSNLSERSCSFRDIFTFNYEAT